MKISRLATTIAAFVAITATAGILGADRARAISFWGEEPQPTPHAAEEPAREAAPAKESAAQAPIVTSLPDFATIADRVGPAVANISTTSQSEAPQMQQQQQNPMERGGNPHEFWEPFERFFGPMPKRPFRERSLGSGFIINRDGFILTNNHVVENAEKIVVKLSDDKEYEAKIVGRDPKTDIAVIKIDGAKDLKPVPLGDSDALRVGEWVMAIGNPFGLEHTVTAGIVSAKGRYIGQGSYDQFIQTDVAINPGNSGGPLLNLRGEVVGINSAIFSRSGGNIGIGFAIPINLAKELLPELEEKGKVTRGWLGVMIQKVTPEIAESLGLDQARGALVADVMKEGPAKEAGIEVGDVIVEFDGHSVKDSTELPLLVARTGVGKSVEVKVLRNGKAHDMTVRIAELKDEAGEVAKEETESQLGLAVQPLTPEITESLGLDEGTQGVVVSGVEPGSPAEEAGLQRGDVILEVNREQVKDMRAYRKAMGGLTKDKSVLFLVRRGNNTIFIPVKP